MAYANREKTVEYEIVTAANIRIYITIMYAIEMPKKTMETRTQSRVSETKGMCVRSADAKARQNLI